MGIRNKFMLCLLAVLMPLVAVGTFATHVVDLQMAERTTAALANTQRLEAARIEQILAGYANDARSLASGPHVSNFVSTVPAERVPDQSTTFADAIGSHDQIASSTSYEGALLRQLALTLQRKAGSIGSSVVELKLVNRDGQTLGKTDGFSWSPADEKLVERSMGKAKTVFGEAFVNEGDRKRLGMVSPILSHAGRVVGALIMEARLGPIINLISKHEEMGDSIEAHIAQPTLQGHAQLITDLRFERNSAFQKIVAAHRDLPVNQALSSPESKVIKALDYRGVESFLALQTIAYTGWGLVVKIDTAETYAPVEKLRTWLWWATAASIGFVALIYLFFLVPVAGRLKRAATAARQILDGNLSVRLLDNKNDEIAELATSINSLARDLLADQKIRTEVEAKLRHQASHDDLTGLLNRKHANSVIELLTADNETEHSVMFLDLNGFKNVNDLYGHAAGDDVLKWVADRLSMQIPEGSTLARWGGDEFVVISPGTNEQQATEIALCLHNVFDEPAQSSKGMHKISCSIGLATSSKQTPLDQALLDADALMYKQKKYQQDYRTKGSMTTRGVERALQEDRMEMWFQPVVLLERPGNYILIGADTSMRMKDSYGGYVMPEDFMPDIAGSSALRELDERTLELALGAIDRWNHTRIVDNAFYVSIHLSEQTLQLPDFPLLLENRLQTMNILPSQIQLVLPEDPVNLSDSTLVKLNDIGIPLALNGVCYEADLLKRNSPTSPSIAIVDKPCLNNVHALKRMMDTCQKLQLEVLARDVENRDQLTQLHALGVSHFQGNLFDRPVRAIDFVSRWGKTKINGLGGAAPDPAVLRLAG